MIRFLVDSSCDLNKDYLEENNIRMVSLKVNIDGKEYLDGVDLDRNAFYEILTTSEVFPKTSQPSPQSYVDFFEEVKENGDECICIMLSSGLSGTYQSMVGVKNSIENNDHIHVINSKTLCGPHRYMVKRALEMQKNGATLEEVLKEVDRLCNSHKSFLIPQDFGFLKRGGRLTPLAATIGGLMRIVPVMTQTDDGRKLEKHSIARTMKKAVASIADHFKSMGVDGEGWLISVSHADCEGDALKVVEQLKEIFPNTEVELLLLSPAFITQGGPDCIAVQVIKR